MIRVFTTLLAALPATLFFGLLVFVASGIGGSRAPTRIVRLQRSWARAVLTGAGVRVQVFSAERLSEPRARVVVANHASLFDILVLASQLTVPYSWVMKKELSRIFFFGAAVRAAGHVTIDRGNSERAIRSLDRAMARLTSEPLTVVIFPEGSRTETGELQPFKRGAFVLAIRAGVEVVPAAIEGSFGVKPKGLLRVRPGTVKVRFGKPIPTQGSTTRDRAALARKAQRRVQALLDAMRDCGERGTKPPGLA